MDFQKKFGSLRYNSTKICTTAFSIRVCPALFEGLGAKREPEKCEREQTGPGMVLVIDKRTVHVQVPDSPVISFSSSKNFSLQIWYSCEAVFTCVRVLTVSEVLS